MGILSKIGIAPAVGLGNLVTAGLEKITGKEYGRTTIREASETKTGKILGAATAITGAALIGAATASSPAAITAVKAGTKTAVKIGGEVTKKVSGAALDFAVKKPVQALFTGAFIAGGGLKLVKPTFEKTKELTQAVVPKILGDDPITKEDIVPIIKDLAPIVGIGLPIVGATTYLLPKILDSDKEKDKVIEDIVIPDKKIEEKVKEVVSELPKETATTGTQPNIAVTQPVLPETQTITATTGTATKKRKKTRSKALPQQIRQSVDIDIINNNSSNRITKKYINTIALRN